MKKLILLLGLSALLFSCEKDDIQEGSNVSSINGENSLLEPIEPIAPIAPCFEGDCP